MLLCCGYIFYTAWLCQAVRVLASVLLVIGRWEIISHYTPLHTTSPVVSNRPHHPPVYMQIKKSLWTSALFIQFLSDFSNSSSNRFIRTNTIVEKMNTNNFDIRFILETSITQERKPPLRGIAVLQSFYL